MRVPDIDLRDLVPGHGVGLTAALNMGWSGPGLHAVVGRNGTGKSTLMRTVAGLMRPVSGAVEVGGRPVTAWSAWERAERLAFVDSTPPRGSGLSVGEVLTMADREGREEVARQWLGRLGDAEWWAVPVNALSDGQAQRVMVARAAAQGCPWMVLDEPTAFLDVPAREDLMQLLEVMVGEGRALLVTTHDLHLLEHSPALKTIHMLDRNGLQALDPEAKAKEWEIALR